MAHIVIIGAGIGGMPMAYEMKDLARKEDKVTVISDTPKFHFVPSNPWVAVNWRKRSDIEMEIAPALQRRGIGFVNQAAKLRYMLGGEAAVPVVFRMPSGSGTGAAAQHSQSFEAWFGHVPGLKVVQPSTPAEAKGMLLAAPISAPIASGKAIWIGVTAFSGRSMRNFRPISCQRKPA